MSEIVIHGSDEYIKIKQDYFDALPKSQYEKKRLIFCDECRMPYLREHWCDKGIQAAFEEIQEIKTMMFKIIKLLEQE